MLRRAYSTADKPVVFRARDKGRRGRTAASRVLTSMETAGVITTGKDFDKARGWVRERFYRLTPEGRAILDEHFAEEMSKEPEPFVWFNYDHLDQAQGDLDLPL